MLKMNKGLSQHEWLYGISREPRDVHIVSLHTSGADCQGVTNTHRAIVERKNESGEEAWFHE